MSSRNDKKRQGNVGEKNEQTALGKASLSWYPGHMAKSKKQIIEDLKLVDIVVEVLDARIPRSSSNPDVESYCDGKEKIVVLNKVDLANDVATNEWIDYYESLGTTAIAMEANNSKDLSKLLKALEKINNKIRAKYVKKGRSGYEARAIILGIPNVGKSTLINSLSKKSTAKVENRPGVTRENKWIRLENGMDLLDTPGMLWPRFDDEKVAMNLAFTNSIGQNAIDIEEIAFKLLEFLVKNYAENVEKRYGIELKEDPIDPYLLMDIRDEIARKRGAILSGGRVDDMKISNIIVNDFRDGKLGKISLERPEK